MSRRAKRRYEKKMSEYYNAEYNLGVYLDRLSTALSKCNDSYEDFPRVYKEEENLYGNVMDDFNSKSQTYDKHMNSVLEEADNKKILIECNKERAHERYEHYKDLYEHEEDDD